MPYAMRTTLFDLFIIFIAISFVTYRLNYDNPSITPAASCGMRDLELESTSSSDDITTVTLWASASFRNCWRAFAPVLAAKLVTDEKLRVEPRALTSTLQSVERKVEEAAQKGSAPDIVQITDYWFANWARMGWLAPIDTCIQTHPQFAGVDESIWRYARWENKTWVVPMGIGITAFYYNKTKLRQLHWTEEMIDDLPQRIQQGSWTIEEMWKTISQARELGVIKSDEGFWSSFNREQSLLLAYMAYGGSVYDAKMQRLIIDRQALEQSFGFHHQLIDDDLIPQLFTARGSLGMWPNGSTFRDAVANEKALFWVGTLSHWRQYNESLNIQNDDDLANRIGVALFPTSQKGKAGVGYVTSIDWYAITSEQAGGRQLQNQACEILAQTLTPAIHSLNIEKSVLLSAVPRTVDSPQAKYSYIDNAAESMRKDTIFLPIDQPGWLHGFGIMQYYLMRVESGELSPEIASEAAVMELQSQANFFAE